MFSLIPYTGDSTNHTITRRNCVKNDVTFCTPIVDIETFAVALWHSPENTNSVKISNKFNADSL